jgi:hypothetical protein
MNRRSVLVGTMFILTCAASSISTVLVVRLLFDTDHPASAVPSPAPDSLEDVETRLRALEARPLLREKSTTIREQAPASDEGAASAKTQHEMPSPEEQALAAEEWGRQLTELVRRQPDREEWSQKLMAELQDVVATKAFADTRILESECGGELCRVLVQTDSSNPDRLEDMRGDLLVTEPFKRTSLVFTKDTGKLEIFLAKTGRSIPKRQGEEQDG